MDGALSGRTLGGGAYRVGALLGEGAMGAVYEGVQDALGRSVAIKVLHASRGQLRQDQFTRFQREAKAAAALGHANIVQITDFQWLPGEPPFLVMERLVGQSLGSAMTRGGKLSPQRVSFIAAQVLSALQAAHQAGIVHRDIKPDNVFLTLMAMVNDIVKVLDFGVAKLLDEAPLTMAGAMIGSPAYMPPEQAFGRPVDARADVYAVGATMYHALSGVLPVDASDVGSFLAKVELPTTPLVMVVPGFDPALSEVVAKAMAKRPEDRFPSADAMRQALMPWARPRRSSAADLTAQVPTRTSLTPQALERPSVPVPPSSHALPQSSSPSLQASQAPGFSGASQAPGFSGASQAQGLSGASQAPGFSGASQAPGFSGASQAPGFSGASQAPGLSGASQAPGLSGAWPVSPGAGSGLAPVPMAVPVPRSSRAGLFVGLGVAGVGLLVVAGAALLFVVKQPPQTPPHSSPQGSVESKSTSVPPQVDPPKSEPTLSASSAPSPVAPTKPREPGVVDAGSRPSVADAAVAVHSNVVRSAVCAQSGPPPRDAGVEFGLRSLNPSIARECLVYGSFCLRAETSATRTYRVRMAPNSGSVQSTVSTSRESCMPFDDCIFRLMQFSSFNTSISPTFDLACTIVK